MSQILPRTPVRPKETVLSYKDCLLSGGTSKSLQQGCQKTGRESPLPVGPMVPVKPSSEEEEAEFIQPAAEAEKEKNIEEMDKLLKDLSSNHAALKEQLAQEFAELRKIIDEKEKSVLETYQTVYDKKHEAITKCKQGLISSSGDDSMRKEFPTLLGGVHCGFLPDSTSMLQSSVSLMLEHREELKLGEKTRASVIGSINLQGQFWVRALPDNSSSQEIMLLNLSNTMSAELALTTSHFLRLGRVTEGDLCCAQYAEDQRWYRGRITGLLGENKAQVFFLDYGNSETIEITNLFPLDPKFQVYPFQMKQCCFCEDTELVYGREVRWKFTDLTHGNDLTVKVLEILPSNSKGLLHQVELVNLGKNGEQPFDVGTVITLMAQPAKGQASKNIRYRDVRYAGKVPIQQQTITNNPQPDKPPVSSTVTPPTSTPLNQEGSHSDCDVEEPPRKREEDNSSDGYFTQSSDGALNNSSSYDGVVPGTPKSSKDVAPHVSSKEFDAKGLAVEAAAAVTQAEMSTESSNAAEALPGAQAMGISDEPVTSSASCLVKGNTPTPNYSEVVARSNSNSPLPSREVRGVGSPCPPREGKSDSTQVKEIRSEPRGGKGSGFSQKSSSPRDTDAHQIVLKEGQKCDVFVTTPLLKDGTFWVQNGVTELTPFLEMVEMLQVHCTDTPPTPVFLSPGECCAALFSEDQCWYRARIECVVKNKFKVRYVDYGNCELRERDCLMKLGSEFKLIPFQAVRCSIAIEDHTSFTGKEIEKFNSLTETQKLKVKVLAAEQGKAVLVELFQLMEDGSVLNINEEVYTANKLALNSLGSLSKLAVSASNWADCMDAIESPKNDGIFTIPGQDTRSPSHASTQSKPTPSPSISPTLHAAVPRSSPLNILPTQATNPHSTAAMPSSSPPQSNFTSSLPSSPPTCGTSSLAKATATYSSRVQSSSVSPTFPRKAEKNRGTVKNTSHQNNLLVAPTASWNPSVPRIQTSALSLVRKNLQAAESEMAKQQKKPTLDQEPSTAADAGGPQSSNTSPALATPTVTPQGPQPPQPKGIRSLNQAIRNGTAFPPSGRRRKSPDADSTQIMDKDGGMKAVKELDGIHMAGSPKPLSVQPYKGNTTQSPQQAKLDSLPQHSCTRLFVKNVPLDRSSAHMRDMFSQYGKVLGLVPIASRKNVIYMYMEPKGAQVAIDNLHGKAISKFSKPMIVELSNPPRSNRS